MSTNDPQKKTKRTTTLLPQVGQSAKRFSHNTLQRLFRHLSEPTSADSERPSKRQIELAVTGFSLGVVSILASIFPICGLLTSVCALLIGVYERRKSGVLQIMTSWTIALSVAGLVLSVLYTIVTVSLYMTVVRG